MRKLTAKFAVTLILVLVTMLSVTVLGGCGKPAAAAPPPAQTPVVEEPVEEPVAEPVMKEPIDPFGERTANVFDYTSKKIKTVINVQIWSGSAGYGLEQPLLCAGYKPIPGVAESDLVVPVAVTLSNKSDMLCSDTAYEFSRVLTESQELYHYNNEGDYYEPIQDAHYIVYDQEAVFMFDLLLIWRDYYSEDGDARGDSPQITILTLTMESGNVTRGFAGEIHLAVENETFVYTTVGRVDDSYSEPIQRVY